MSESTIVSLNSGPPAASRSPRSSGASREVVPDAAHQHGEEHRGEEHRGIRQVEEKNNEPCDINCFDKLINIFVCEADPWIMMLSVSVCVWLDARL